MASKTVVQAARRYDAVYDRDYYVSSAMDHSRSMQRVNAAEMESVPSAQAMFSALAHHPHATLRMRTQDPLPRGVPRGDMQTER